MKPFLLLGLCAVLSLTACNKDIFMDTTNRKPGYGSDGLPYADEAPEVKANPNRKEHYQMVIKIKDAPLTFQVIRGSEQYQAMNCRYTTSRFAGSTISPHHAEQLKYIKVDDETYVTEFYTDTPLNEDYYGQGVCKWQFLSAGTSLLPTGIDERETILRARVAPEDLEKLHTGIPEIKIKHEYQKKNYPMRSFVEEGEEGMPDSGIKGSGLILEPKDIFSVELTIRKVEK